MKKLTYSMLMLTSLLGCAGQTDDSVQQPDMSKAVDAILTSPSAAATKRLTAVIAKLMQQKDVTISTQAFTEHSVISIERKAHVGPDGHVIAGRTTDKPRQFKLLKVDGACIVQDVDSGAYLTVAELSCQAK